MEYAILHDKLCRGSNLPIQGLKDMLQAASTPEALCEDLASLIAQYGIPGEVSHWLPPMQDLEIWDAPILNLWETCYIAESAPLVAKMMMQYKPHSVVGRPTHMAMFLVRQEGPNENLILPRLRAYALSTPPHDLIDWAVNEIKCSGSVCDLLDVKWDEFVGYNCKITELPGFPATSRDVDLMYGSATVQDVCLTSKLYKNLIGGDHKFFGSKLMEQLRIATAGTGVSFGHGKIVAIERNCYSQCARSGLVEHH